MGDVKEPYITWTLSAEKGESAAGCGKRLGGRTGAMMTEAAFINPRLEQIKLSACKRHPALVCYVCVKFCSGVEDEPFTVAARR